MGNYFDIKAIQEALTKEDVIKIVADLGSPDHKIGGSGELIFRSICHGSDSWKLYYYHEPNGNYPGRIFHCYSRCGGASFSVFELVIRVRRRQGVTLTFPQAVKYVASLTNNMLYSGKDAEETNYRINDWDWINKYLSIKKNNAIPQLTEINEHILEIFCPYPHELWLNEGISKESMKKYQISYWGKENKIISPHRDIQGRLIGIRGRSLNDDEVAAGYKYMPINIEGKELRHSLGSNLYGLCQNEEAIRRIGKIMLFESEKSVLKCDTYYHQDNFSVAVCGSSLTDTQCKLIRSLGVREVMLAFDKEYEDPESKMAQLYANKLLNKVNKLTPYFTVYILWDKEGLLQYKDSPADQGKEVLEKLMKTKIEIKTKE